MADVPVHDRASNVGKNFEEALAVVFFLGAEYGVEEGATGQCGTRSIHPKDVKEYTGGPALSNVINMIVLEPKGEAPYS